MPSPAQGRLRVTIVGSGAAAMAAALRASEGGAEVTVIERGTIGGTCVNVGCVPSKSLIRSAYVAHLRRVSPFDAGVSASPVAVSRTSLLVREQQLVADMRRRKYEQVLAETPRVGVMRGETRFEGPNRLVVSSPDGEARLLTFDRCLIATGARPVVPDIPGLSATPYWTSTDALASGEVPRRLAVIGASAVAVELAQACARLGSEVTVLARSTVLSGEDPAIGAALERVFRAEGMSVRTHTRVLRVDHDGRVFTLATGGGEVQAEALLVATGRVPDTGALELGRVGVMADARGAVMVDDYLRTTGPDVFAAGDCTDRPPFVYVAAAAGARAAANMLGAEVALDLSAMPMVLFTDPEVATVGRSALQAQADGMETEIRRLSLEDVPRAVVNGETAGFITLVAEAGSRRLLGAQAVAPGAGEIIQTAAIAIRAGLRIGDLADALFPYLTMSEGLKLAAQSFDRDIGRLPCCAG